MSHQPGCRKGIEKKKMEKKVKGFGIYLLCNY